MAGDLVAKSGTKTKWVPVANADGKVREIKEKRVLTHQETDEVKEIEERQHFGDITDEVREFLQCIIVSKSMCSFARTDRVVDMESLALSNQSKDERRIGSLSITNLLIKRDASAKKIRHDNTSNLFRGKKNYIMDPSCDDFGPTETATFLGSRFRLRLIDFVIIELAQPNASVRSSGLVTSGFPFFGLFIFLFEAILRRLRLSRRRSSTGRITVHIVPKKAFWPYV